jgi:hypothetical protein
MGAPAPARGAFGQPALLSGTQQLEFGEADSPALAQDGRYAAFRGTLAGVPGVYRRDLSSGEVLPVAIEDAANGGAVDAPDAAAPSISADGRYIAFTSAHDLDPALEPAADSGCPEVYVRDMSVSWPQAQAHPELAYTLASAASGSSEGLTFAAPCPARPPSELAIAGAQAAPGVALSADGRKVAFTVLSASNLSAPCGAGQPPACLTEPSQVALRDLDAHTTTLVSATPAGQPTPGGGAYPSTLSEHRLGGASTAIESTEPTASTAALSADGSTVSWLGTDLPEQVPAATDVTAGMANYGGVGLELEPLWRRVAAGAAAVTRRLLGEAGLNFYFGPPHENAEFGAEGGSLAPTSHAFLAPALSADGDTVATIANAPTPVNEGSYRFLEYNVLPPAEAYAIQLGGDAHPRVTPLTATPNFAQGNAVVDPIADVAISADGTRVAFNTLRVAFALSAPTLISPPTPELDHTYTYEANLALGTLERVVNTYEGAPPNGGSGLLSFGPGGSSLAFASHASNLFYGDITGGASQVYLASELPSASTPPSQSIAPPPPGALPIPAWTLNATAAAQRDGSVFIYTQVPGAGRLEVSALAQLPAPAASGRGARRARGRAAARRTRGGRLELTRAVARASAPCAGPTELRLRIRVEPAYRALVASRDGLYAVLRLSFAAAGHATLTREIPVTFHRLAHRGRRATARGWAGRGRWAGRAG